MLWQTTCWWAHSSWAGTIFEVKNGKMTVNFEHDAARKLWDNYYVPFVKGWICRQRPLPQ